MKKQSLLGILCLSLALGFVNIAMSRAEMVSYSKPAVDLQQTMRKLWEDHVIYTRNYVISAAAGLEDIDVVTKRLLKNQDEIGDAIKPYYGDAAGKNLASLLREHIVLAGEVVKAAKADDKERLKDVQARWEKNGNDIAVFLSSANPNWSMKDLASMMQKHLDLLTGQVTARLKKNWGADVDYYDKGHDHILMLTDALTEGIIKQFPEKF